MAITPELATPEVERSLAAWHAMVGRRDLSGLADIVHPDAVFRSPVSHAAYGPAEALLLALETVIQVFGDFTYHRQLASADGLDVMLEFSATVGDRKLKGIDLIRFGADGRIVEFEVMVRPLSGVQALAAEMGARIGERIQAFKLPG